MKIGKIKDTEKGWFIGDFPKAVFQSKEFEVSWRIHKAGEFWELHYQKSATEINLLVRGSMTINDVPLSDGDIFILYPYELTEPVFLTDCEVICIKTPSLPTDKVVVKKT